MATENEGISGCFSAHHKESLIAGEMMGVVRSAGAERPKAERQRLACEATAAITGKLISSAHNRGQF
jgi:hypothetical protein